MSNGGKGDAARPLGISKEKYSSNWDLIFKKGIDKKFEPEVIPEEIVNYNQMERCTNREVFEKEFLEMKPEASVERDNLGRYIDPHCRLYWAAYNKAFAKFKHNFIEETHRGGSLYFIGGYPEANKTKRVSFSNSPHFHKDLTSAELEAQRLAEVHGGKFMVFGRVSPIFKKVTKPVE